MSTPILICTGISVLLLLIILALITYRLGVIAKYLIHIYGNLMWFKTKIMIELEKRTKPVKKDRTETTKRYNRTHRLVLDRKLGKHRWVKKSECHRELNLATGKEIWVANE